MFGGVWVQNLFFEISNVSHIWNPFTVKYAFDLILFLCGINDIL